MLSELVVRDLGVIDELALVLGPGLTVVSGETGAGKTLVVEAIGLLVGGRADASLVRPGAAEAEIEGRFVHGDDEVVVRRVIPRQGRSRAYIDGRLATVSALAELGRDLVDLHGQHAHQSLLSPAVQRAALDRFGGVDTRHLASLLDDRRVLDAELAQLGGDERARAREIDLLRHQLDEIDGARLDDPAEDERLDAEEDLLADAVAHREAAAVALAAVGADGAGAEAVGAALAALRGRPPFSDLASRLETLAAEIADVAAELRARAETIEDDPARLAEIRRRRQVLADLRRKYGDTLAEVLAYGDEVRARLAELESHDQKAAELEARGAELDEAIAAERARVGAARRVAAPALARAVQARLRELAMPVARLDVTVDGVAGEKVVFAFSANEGHPPQPLSRVASGGELARAMLALRLELTAGPPTLVFDEVDAGIGGEAALAVGASLRALGEDHQVLVVTHLAQVAAHADTHVSVSKHARSGSTVSVARVLDPAERVVELSRMLSGTPESDAARRHATELLAAVGASAPASRGSLESR